MLFPIYEYDFSQIVLNSQRQKFCYSLDRGKLLRSTGSSAQCPMMTWRGEAGWYGRRKAHKGEGIYIYR